MLIPSPEIALAGALRVPSSPPLKTTPDTPVQVAKAAASSVNSLPSVMRVSPAAVVV